MVAPTPPPPPPSSSSSPHPSSSTHPSTSPHPSSSSSSIHPSSSTYPSSSSNFNVSNPVCRPPPAPTAPFRPNRLSINNSTNIPPPVSQPHSVSVPVAPLPQQQDHAPDLLSTACERLNKIARTLRAQVETRYDRVGGQDHCPLFSATITLLPQRYTATATGSSKMASRRAASLQILNILGDKAATYDPRRVRTPKRENGRASQFSNSSGASPSNVSSPIDIHNNNSGERKNNDNHVQSTPSPSIQQQNNNHSQKSKQSSGRLSKSIPFVIDRQPDPELMFVLEKSSGGSNKNQKQVKKEVTEVASNKNSSRIERENERTKSFKREDSPPIPRKRTSQNDDFNRVERFKPVTHRSSDSTLSQPRSVLSPSESRNLNQQQGPYVRPPRSSQHFIRGMSTPSQKAQSRSSSVAPKFIPVDFTSVPRKGQLPPRSSRYIPTQRMMFSHPPNSPSAPTHGHISPQSPNTNGSNTELYREAIISRSRGVVTKYQPSADPRKAAKVARQESIKRRETDTSNTTNGNGKIVSHLPSPHGTKDNEIVNKSNAKLSENSSHLEKQTQSNVALRVSKTGEEEISKEQKKDATFAQSHVKGTSETVRNPLRSATKPQILKDQSNNAENKRLEVAVTQTTKDTGDVIKHTTTKKSTPSDNCVTLNRGNTSTDKMQSTLANKVMPDNSLSSIHKPAVTSAMKSSSNPTTTNIPSSTVIHASVISNTQPTQKTISIPTANKTLSMPSPDATSVGSSSSHFTPESDKSCDTRLKSDETTGSKQDSSTQKVIQENTVTNGTLDDSLEEGEVVDDMCTRSKAQDNSPPRTSRMATRSSGKKNDPADIFENVVQISPNFKLRVKCSTPEELAEKKRQREDDITPMDICNGNKADEISAANIDKARKDNNAESRKAESSKSKNGKHITDSHSTDDKKSGDEDKGKMKEKKDKSKGKDKPKGKKEKRGTDEEKTTDESGSSEPPKKLVDDEAFTEINGVTSNNETRNGSSSRSNQRSTRSGSVARSVTGSVGQGHKEIPSQEKQEMRDESVEVDTENMTGEGSSGHVVIHHPAVLTGEEISDANNTIQLPRAGLPFAKRKRTYYQSLETTNRVEEDSGEELAARPPRKRAKRELPNEQKRLRLMIFCDYENDFSRKALDEVLKADLALDLQIVVASRVERDSFINLSNGKKAEVLDIPPIARSHPGVLATTLAFAVGTASQQMWVQRVQHVANGGPIALWPRILIIHPNPVFGALRKPGVIEVVHPNHEVVEAVRTMIDRAIDEAECE